MAYYYPRMATLARVPDPSGSRILELPLRVRTAELLLNDHNQPDELDITCDWQNVGIDPRLIRNATIYHYMADAPDGPLAPSNTGGRTGAGNLRFVGTVTTTTRNTAEMRPYEIQIKAADYTDFFLRAKPFGASGIPDYSQTLDDAFRRIVSQTPGAEKLADRLEARGFTSWPRISDAVPKRFAGKGTVHVERNTDAWAVWQHVVGMLGLITFVELDKIVVTTADAYYRKTEPPVFKWGLNIEELTETRDANGFGTGVGITSFDPTSGKTIEGVWPPRQEKAGKRRAVAAAQNTSNPDEAIVQKYDWYNIQEILNEAAAIEFAKRVYAERSKQELQGTLKTGEMRVSDTAGNPFDVLDLRVGDNVYVAANESGVDGLLAQLESTSARVEYLVRQGYDEAAAEVIAAYAEQLATLDNRFYVKQVRHSVDPEQNSFRCEVEYCNQILVDEAK